MSSIEQWFWRKKMDTLVKEIFKFKNIKNIKEIWDTMKRAIKEVEQIQVIVTENKFSKIIEEKFSNRKKEIPTKIREVH